MLKKITEELNETIRGAVISKIHQSEPKLIILKLFCRGKSYKLILP